MKKEITLADVKKFADSLVVNYNEIAEEITNKFGFIGGEGESTWIINPWLDDTGRFFLTDEEAIETYGADNVNAYIESVKEYLSNKEWDGKSYKELINL